MLNKQFFNDYFGEKKEEKEKKKILYIGWIGHKNLGDDLMWELFSEYFEEKFGKQDWELHGTLRKPAKEFDLDTFDLIVLGGGSIICKDHIPFLHRAVEKGKKVMIWGSGIDLINKKDVPLLEAGKKINVQDYYSINLQEKLNEVIEQAEFFGVRGPLTYEIIKQMGANEKKVMISGDPAFLLTSRSNIDKEAKEAILPFKGNKIIGVNWGTSYNYLYGGNEGAVENQLAEALKALIQKGYKVYLYTVWDQDIPSVKQLYKKINDQQNVIIDTNLHDKNFLIDLLSHFHFTINFKLHANYLSLGAETPPIPLAYRFKVIDFAQSIDLDRFIISTDSKTIKDEILKHESTINLERESIVEKMKNKKAEYMNLISEPFTKNLYFNDVEKG
ncbi:polysaccharide pyruvyl transferase family protein [Mesobacillus jeotgali]|uniref:Polysaccharide pyruvyl transferase family protein n=1 Tax=Mesobacillus jeotgali TaxID=129985 RepID=A0ABY9VMB4_9BACI|nr:polysaccharide pyruvyl transferase family protein [Mesobacillus jeotgali]WNF25099.1 polysaccharide pyruvyl transferase family protein [Mesobacillus jeotgali]